MYVDIVISNIFYLNKHFFLTNRSQRFRTGTAESGDKSVVLVCSMQWSILGPLLFLFCMNNLPKVTNRLFAVLCADVQCITNDHVTNSIIKNRAKIWLPKNISCNKYTLKGIGRWKRKSFIIHLREKCVKHKIIRMCSHPKFVSDFFWKTKKNELLRKYTNFGGAAPTISQIKQIWWFYFTDND